uniref:(northern house mosquito) hypothetical protein n=1 Tax=Culex pipiens TaxID=7175 RepID=A0A8D8B5K8_CULPI
MCDIRSPASADINYSICVYLGKPMCAPPLHSARCRPSRAVPMCHVVSSMLTADFQLGWKRPPRSLWGGMNTDHVLTRVRSWQSSEPIPSRRVSNPSCCW